MYRKKILPNYTVFDEQRYFVPGDEPCVVDVDGVRCGLIVCEDIWFPEPAAQSRAAGAELLIVPNGSPYHTKQQAARREVVAARARENGVAIVYVNRVGGLKQGSATDWVPASKPIWFTELGCPAVDKGTNQPNVFHDPKSSESFLPYHSDGSRDDLIQHRYLQAVFAHWARVENNPLSPVYGGPMVDMSRAHVWAWDARPWPDFPDRLETWIDGDNYQRGHWLNGRMTLV